MNTLTGVGIGIAALPIAYFAYGAAKDIGKCPTGSTFNLAEGNSPVSTSAPDKSECVTFGDALKNFGQAVFQMAVPTYLLPHESAGEDWSGLLIIYTIPFYLGVGLAIWGARK